MPPKYLFQIILNVELLIKGLLHNVNVGGIEQMLSL
jgi:hypothetical protein